MPLNAEEELRYSRHLVLPQVGLRGQERLARARVLIVGLGGLGSPAALYLAAAGVGTLGLADADTVDVTNLQRQILHSGDTLGQQKVDSAARALHRLNPHPRLIPIPARLTAANALALIAEYDLVIDGTDNFPTRYLLNDACALQGKPLVFGSIYRFEGQVSVFDARRGPCYRCLFPTPPPPEQVPTCAEGGVLGCVPGVIGTLQATEALKLLLEIGEPLIGRLLFFDALAMRTQEIRLARDPDCPLCGTRTQTALIDYQGFCGVEEADAVRDEWEIGPERLAACSSAGVRLLDIRDAGECEDMPGIPGAEHLPYPAFAQRMHELDSSREIVIYCATGSRSWQAVRLLRSAGFTRAWSLHGGLLGWRMLMAVPEVRSEK